MQTCEYNGSIPNSEVSLQNVSDVHVASCSLGIPWAKEGQSLKLTSYIQQGSQFNGYHPTVVFMVSVLVSRLGILIGSGRI